MWRKRHKQIGHLFLVIWQRLLKNVWPTKSKNDEKVRIKLLQGELSLVSCACQCRVILTSESETLLYFPLIPHGQLAAVMEKLRWLSKSFKIICVTTHPIRNFMLISNHKWAYKKICLIQLLQLFVIYICYFNVL